MKLIETKIPGVILIEPDLFADNRGHFLETFHQSKYQECGIGTRFVQDNFSFSVQNTLRGLHYQLAYPQAKLVTCLFGEIFDVVVDIRVGSPTFGHWIGEVLSSTSKKQLFVPEGFAHGFIALSDTAGVTYKCSGYYDPRDERGILWSDARLGITWPKAEPILSEKDKKHPELHMAREGGVLPTYSPSRK